MALSTITLPPLPYAKDALSPYISEETLEFHYGKHHQTYVNNLQKMFASMPDSVDCDSLIRIIQTSEGGIFNNAAQIWNHAFYWDCLSPKRDLKPSEGLGAAIDKQFGSFADFQQEFDQKAATVFGSGWCWLVMQADQSLAIKQTSNAQTPLTTEDKPLLTCDVWEHAYYIDTRNSRPEYLKNFWTLVNWEFVSKMFAGDPLPDYS
jgi:superoxide dismutase, Fe-Mn family